MEAREPGQETKIPCAAWNSLKLTCGSAASGAAELGDTARSAFSAAPSVEFLDGDIEAMRELGIHVLDKQCSWDHTYAPAPSGELVRERSVAYRATDLFTGTHGPKGLTGLSLSVAALNNAKALGTSMNMEQTQSGENAVRGKNFTWVRGENVGMGSMGSVCKGLNQKTGEIIAVKEVRVHEGQTADMKYVKALENEISILQDLRHPQIVSFLGFDYIDSILYVYLDYMPGGSLAQVILDFGALDECLIASYTHDVVKGLEYLHSRQPPVLHRDIKGANILVDLECKVKLADFGCSRRSEDLASGTIRGSIPWMAPEVIKQKHVGPPADIWSLGCVIIEMATGKLPWGGFDNFMAAMYKIGLSTESVPVPDELSHLGQEFVRLCVDRDPDRRPRAEELLGHGFLGALLETSLR